MRLGLAVLALVLALASAASASTVSVVPEKGPVPFATLRYEAAPGEINAVVVTFPGVDAVSDSATVTDPGATITAGTGCTQVDAHTATCKHDDSFLRSRVSLGDMDDSATSTGSQLVALIADGGPGNDTLTGANSTAASQASRLNGGPGADHLTAGQANALLIEGDPDSDPQPDVIDGGEFRAGQVSYAGRTQGVTIDLEGQTGGADGENDVIKNVYGAYGGAGDDTLISAGDTRYFSGGKGDDKFTNTGVTDDDLGIDGGKGIDTYTCASPSPEQIYDPQIGELIDEKCTRISNQDWTITPVPAKHTSSSVTFKLRCPLNYATDFQRLACQATLKLTDPKSGAAVGTATFAAPKGRQPLQNVVVALTKRGRALLRKDEPVDAALAAKKFKTLRWTFPLSAVD
jgi:hypothetical protein